MQIIGTCGKCGGAVGVPSIWFGVDSPTPTCRNCGRTPKNAFGLTLPMREPACIDIAGRNSDSIQDFINSFQLAKG